MPLISIVIATKNRLSFIKELVEYYSKWSQDLKVEIIIHDNSDQSYLEEMNQIIKDDRISYIHSDNDFDMRENCNAGILASKGKYVCLTGDDDFAIPEIYRTCIFMNEKNIPASVSEPTLYLWPNVDSYWFSRNNSGVIIKAKDKRNIQVISSDTGLRKILIRGGSDFMGYLPSVYHGIHSKELLLSVYEKHGTFFPGSSPDIANAIAACEFYESFCFWDKSFMVSGASPGSGAAEGFKKEHHGKISDRGYMFSSEKVFWPSDIPHFFSGPTIYSVSVIEALGVTQKGYSNKLLNLPYLYAICLIFHPSYYKEIKRAMNNYPYFGSSLITILYVFKVFFLRLTIFINNFMRFKIIKTKKYRPIYKIYSPSDASDIFNN